MVIHAFDGRQAVLVDPREIRAGDFMRDCGRLRRVESVEAIPVPIALGVLVRFSDDPDGPFTTLSIPVGGGVTVVVWRLLDGTAGAGHAAA